jgi:hypothetical protein
MHKSGQGWGNIIKGAGVAPNQLSMGQAIKGSGAKDKPTKAPKNNTNQGQGKGKGK